MKYSFDSLEQEAYLNLWRTYDQLKSIEDNFFQEFDLTAQQYNVLRLLRDEHPQPLQTLVVARRLISKAPDITRILDKLSDRELVSRNRPADNRRVVEVQILQPGLELLQKLDEQLGRCHQHQLGHLKQAELKELTRLLRLARQPHENPKSFWYNSLQD